MRKKILSLCMALALCLGLLPATALAVDTAPQTLYVGSTTITTGYWTSSDGGTNWTSQQEEPTGDSYIHYNGQGTLELHNATIQGGSNTVSAPYGSGIYALCGTNQSVSLTIQLTGNNTITGDFGIYVEAQQGGTLGANASLLIQTSDDDGSLEVSGSSYGIYVKSGTGDASLTIQNASVDAKTTQTSSSYAGVCVQSGATATGSPQLSLAVNGGSLTTSASEGNDGIQFYVGSSQATGATTSLTVSENAIVDARNGGIKAYNAATDLSDQIVVDSGTDTSGGIVFDGTEGTVYGEVELQNDLTIGAGETLTIGDGASLTVPSGKTLTNNGTINNSGTLTNNGTVTNNGTLNVNEGGNLGGTPTGGSGTVVNAPAITAQPADTTVTEGQTASFTVTATGENPTYQWQQSTDKGQSWTEISGATGSTYTVAPTTTSMNGYQYRCVVSNSAGSVTSAAATLTVTQPVTGVTLDQTELSLYTGESKPLTAKVEPNDATNKNVTWSSDKPEVATVDNGVVTAVGAGTATITVKTVDGSHTATCAVTVEKPYTPPPYIPPSKPNWTSVARKLANAQPGDTVTVKMNGETEVPGEVWETIAGRDVTVVLDMGGDVSWTVDGNDVPTATHFADMDFGVDRNTTGIDVDVINAITGEVSSVQITLAHDGAFGFTLTLTAPLGRENAGYWANLYHYDEDAKTLNYETSAQVASDGTASLRMTHASQYAIIIDDQTHQLPFEDVTSGTWYEGAVRYAYLHDIMEGMSATTFQPNGTLSRAMAVQIFYNLEGQPDVSDENLGYPYEDVDAQAWYGNAVYWARLTGVATGYGDGTFQPTDSITRQEFARMLYNYAKYKDYDLSAEGDLSQFPDSGSVADWAEAAMSWANGNELINGHDDGTIDAAGIGTRAQAASILMRFDQNLVEK